MFRRLLILALSLALLFAPTLALAASPAMPSIGTPVYPIVIHLSGQYTTSVAAIANFRAPFPLRVLYVTAITQAKGGTQGTSTIQLKNLTATANITSALDISGTAGTVVEASSFTTQNVAKDAVVSADLVISGGSSPTIDNITLTVWVQRRN